MKQMCSIHSFSQNECENLRGALLNWYDKNKRDLPWRRKAMDLDPNIRGYAVWVSEIMLQQTQVKTVIDYYERWMKKWPTVNHLASASLDEVNSVWSGLGYYSRARLLHEAAKKIVDEFHGQIPQSADLLKSTIPGVGRYTAGAISSIAFNKHAPVLDGNVIRVLTRLRQIGAPVNLSTTMDHLWKLADQLVDQKRPGDFNQSLMELGALCCTPKQPNCSVCPLKQAKLCKAYEQNCVASVLKKEKPDIEECHLCPTAGTYEPRYLPELCIHVYSLGVMNYPFKSVKQTPSQQSTLVVVVYFRKAHTICRKNHEDYYFLMFQRPKSGLLAGLWEFPSYTLERKQNKKDKVEENLSVNPFTDQLIDQIVEATNHPKEILRDIQFVGEIVHIFSHIHMTYNVKSLEILPNSLIENVCENDLPKVKFGRWLTAHDLQQSAVSTVTRKIYSLFESVILKSNAKPADNTNKRVANRKSVPFDSKQSKLDQFFN